MESQVRALLPVKAARHQRISPPTAKASPGNRRSRVRPAMMRPIPTAAKAAEATVMAPSRPCGGHRDTNAMTRATASNAVPMDAARNPTRSQWNRSGSWTRSSRRESAGLPVMMREPVELELSIGARRLESTHKPMATSSRVLRSHVSLLNPRSPTQQRPDHPRSKKSWCSTSRSASALSRSLRVRMPRMLRRSALSTTMRRPISCWKMRSRALCSISSG